MLARDVGVGAVPGSSFFREPVNNLIVVNTITASANAAGEAIDSMKWSEVMGTIAGDNTLLIITRSNEAAEALMTKFNNMLNG